MIDRTLRRVLAADADERVLRLVKNELSAESYAVVTAADGREAWRALKAPAAFNAAFVALELPGFGGLELLKMIKADPYLRRVNVVVMVPGDSGHEVRAECFAAGAFVCLPKPFTKSQLLSVARLTTGGRV